MCNAIDSPEPKFYATQARRLSVLQPSASVLAGQHISTSIFTQRAQLVVKFETLKWHRRRREPRRR
jgi:hypothetical protein